MKFAILITTKNRLEDLIFTLDRINGLLLRHDLECIICDDGSTAVSYTHLDVYKRQGEGSASSTGTSDVFMQVFNYLNLKPTVNSVLLIMLFFFLLKAAFRYFDVYYLSLIHI